MWRAANYLSVGQIYLLDNPLLTEPLRAEHVKPRLLGRWGTTPGLNFLYAHLKGWTGPSEVDCAPAEGTWRAHQVPLPAVREHPRHLRSLEEWMRSYRPAESFDTEGRPVAAVTALVPKAERRMGANPHANGGLLLRPLRLPALPAVPVPPAGATSAETTRLRGQCLRAVFERNAAQRNFRLRGPHETASNRLDAVYQATGKQRQAAIEPVDEYLAREGRVLEVLSEHLCQAWLEGYLLTGRNGMFSCYEAFVHIVDSMVNQHIKWLRVHRGRDVGRRRCRRQRDRCA